MRLFDHLLFMFENDDKMHFLSNMYCFATACALFARAHTIYIPVVSRSCRTNNNKKIEDVVLSYLIDQLYLRNKNEIKGERYLIRRKTH